MKALAWTAAAVAVVILVVVAYRLAMGAQRGDLPRSGADPAAAAAPAP